MRRAPIILALASMLGAGAPGEGSDAPDPSLVERLGYPRDAKLLIVHADDLGLSHSANLATFDALASGQVTSASIMVPCEGLQEVAEYASAHPDADLGLHLTLTSDVFGELWGPVAPTTEVPSLLNPDGLFFPTPFGVLGQIDAREVEIELKAQIQRARDLGIRPTHLDSHQLILFMRPDLFEVYLKVGREAGLPVLLSKALFSLLQQRLPGGGPDYESFLGPGDVVLDGLLTKTRDSTSVGWPEYYEKALQALRPGVTEVIIHVGYEGEVPPEKRGDEPFGSAWRQQEFDFFTGPKFEELLEKHDIKLISWRDIAGLTAAD